MQQSDPMKIRQKGSSACNWTRVVSRGIPEHNPDKSNYGYNCSIILKSTVRARTAGTVPLLIMWIWSLLVAGYCNVVPWHVRYLVPTCTFTAFWLYFYRTIYKIYTTYPPTPAKAGGARQRRHYKQQVWTINRLLEPWARNTRRKK